MKRSIIWPTRQAEVVRAREDVADLIRCGGLDAATALEQRITDAVRHAPMATVLPALAIALARAASHSYGAATPRTFGLVAVLLQLAWARFANPPTKH